MKFLQLSSLILFVIQKKYDRIERFIEGKELIAEQPKEFKGKKNKNDKSLTIK